MCDVHGGSSAVPEWMTDTKWLNLSLSVKPRVSLSALLEVLLLLKSLKEPSNERSSVLSEGGHDAETKSSSLEQGSGCSERQTTACKAPSGAY